MSIMPECYADTLLIEALVPPKKRYNHKNSCFAVEGEMRKGVFEDQFAVGIIDNDKNQITYLKEFVQVDSLEGSLLLWKHEKKHHYIVQICPALERWILTICEESQIDITGYGFDGSLENFRKITKSETSLKNESLKNLFREISGRDDIEAVNKLKGWISLLKEKNYQVDLNELKNV